MLVEFFEFLKGPVACGARIEGLTGDCGPSGPSRFRSNVVQKVRDASFGTSSKPGSHEDLLLESDRQIFLADDFQLFLLKSCHLLEEFRRGNVFGGVGLYLVGFC
ncbi:hypothetical protein AMTR_s00080p00106130 [Amborella trichopoda]|uniref:Uncharacterized protein n=1 Tax=Amborella trichopoda TaxID=13333 RepID=W1P4W0_AMBTC|nr:hypothetical protein AMTR_s00080p00106130 [Amborella trichopoda]